MNTKGIKFLAVLAVLAMAFAVFAVVSSDIADDNDAATVTPADPADYFSPENTSTTADVRSIAAGTVASLSAGKYVVTGEVTITASSGDSTIYILPSKQLTITSMSGSVKVIVADDSVTTKHLVSGDIEFTVTAASALVIKTDASNNVELSGTSATFSSAKVAGSSILTVKALTLTNAGTIALNGTTRAGALTVNDASAKITGTSGKIIVNMASGDNDAIMLKTGTIEKQTIDLGNVTSYGIVMADTADKVAILKDNTIYSSGERFIHIVGETSTTATTHEVTGNKFIQNDETKKIKSVVMVGPGEASAWKAKVIIKVTGNDFSGVTKYRDTFGAGGGHEAGAKAYDSKPIRILAATVKIGTSTSDAGVQLVIDAKGAEVGMVSGTTNTEGVYVVQSDVQFVSSVELKSLGILDGQVTIPAGVTVAVSDALQIAGPFINHGTVIVNGTAVVDNNSYNEADQWDVGKIQNDGTFTINGKLTNDSTSNGITNIIETVSGVMDGNGTLVNKGTITSGVKNGYQSILCTVELYPNSVWTGYASTATTDTIKLPTTGTAKAVVFKQNMNGTAISSATFDIYANITVLKLDWLSDNTYADAVTVKNGGIITLSEGTTKIGALDSVTLEKGAQFDGGAGKLIEVNGTLSYAEAEQAYGYASVPAESTTGQIIVPGSGGSSDEKVVVDDAIEGGKIDSSTFDKPANTGASVIVTNQAITEAKVPANKAVVINHQLTDATLEVKEENSEITLNLGAGGSSFTIDTGAGKIKATGLKGSFTFTKGSIVVESKDWSGGSMELEDGDVVKLKGNVTGAVSLTLKTGGTSATVIVEKDETLTIKAGSTLTIGEKVTLEVEGKIVADGAGNATLDIDGKMIIKSGAKVLPVTDCTITISGDGTKNVVYSGATVTGVCIDVADWKGMDANGGTWSFAAGTLTLNNYNGTYNLDMKYDVGGGSYKTIAEKVTFIDLTGNNKITYKFASTYNGAALTLFGSADNKIGSITTASSGSLEISINASSISTGKLFANGLTVINGAAVDINGVTVKITVSGSNSAWTNDDVERMKIKGIIASTSFTTFQATVEMDLMSAYDSDGIYGIFASKDDLSEAYNLNISGTYVEINATNAILANEANIKASHLDLDGSAVFGGAVTVSNISVIDSTTLFVAQSTVTISQESELNVQNFVLEGALTNGGIVSISGNAVFKAAVTNNATLVNDGAIGVYNGTFTNNGTFENNGTFVVFAENAKIPATPTAEISRITITDNVDYMSKIGSKILVYQITLDYEKGLKVLADGSAQVSAKVIFKDKDNADFVAKGGVTTVVFDGVLTPSQTKAGDYTLVLTNDTARITVVYKALTTGGGPNVGADYTVSVSGGIMSNLDVLTYIENNQPKSGAIAGAGVDDAVKTNWIGPAAGGFVASEGKVTNTKDVVLYRIPAVTIVDEDATFEGPIALYAAATIAGTFNGDITSEDDVTVTGEVAGNIVSKKAVTVNKMLGNVTADGNVTVTDSIIGDITAKGDVAVKNMIGNITMNAGGKKVTFSGIAAGTLTYNSEYKANKDDTVKTVAINTLEFLTSVDTNVILAMVPGVDAEGTTPGKAGYFAFGESPSALGEDKTIKFEVTAGIFGVDTSVPLKTGYALVIDKDVTLEVAKIATLDATEAALVVSKDAIRHYEVGPDAAVTYGKVDCIMSFETAEGYYIYSDVAFALSNCDKDATLTVEKNAPINTAVSVKDGVNIIVKNVTLTFNGKNVEMGDGAKITLEGTGKVIFKTSGDNVAAADADEKLEYEYYVVSGTIVYGDNAVEFEDVRFTAESTIVGVAATSSASSKISTTLLYNEGTATISAGTGTGSITLTNASYALTKAAKGDADKYTLVAGVFVISQGAVFDAAAINDAFCVVDYKMEAGATEATIDKYRQKATTVGIEGTLNLANTTYVKGIYAGTGLITLAAGKEFILDKSNAVPDVAPWTNKTIPGSVAAKIVDTTDAANGYVLNLVSAEPNTFLTFKATTQKIGTETVNVMTISGDLGFAATGVVATTAAVLNGLNIYEDAALVADDVYVIAPSTSVGYLCAKDIHMKDATTSEFSTLTYQVTFADDDYTVYTYFSSVDFEEVSDITITDTYALSVLANGEKKVDLSGMDVTINIADGKELRVDVPLIIGTPIDSFGAEGSAIVGKVVILASADEPATVGTTPVYRYLVTYTDVDLTEAEIYQADGKTAAVYSMLLIDDIVYATIFANDGTYNKDAGAGKVQFGEGMGLALADKTLIPDIEGYIFTKWSNLNDDPNAAVGETTAYANAKAISVTVIVKFAEGVSYYLDGVEFAIYDTPTKVDYNSVFTAKINNTAKYEGTPLINGKNSFIVTEDATLTVTGVNPIPVPPEPEPEPVVGDSGLSLTDILLIVLVILIAIMVVILVLRLNRS